MFRLPFYNSNSTSQHSPLTYTSPGPSWPLRWTREPQPAWKQNVHIRIRPGLVAQPCTLLSWPQPYQSPPLRCSRRKCGEATRIFKFPLSCAPVLFCRPLQSSHGLTWTQCIFRSAVQQTCSLGRPACCAELCYGISTASGSRKIERAPKRAALSLELRLLKQFIRVLKPSRWSWFMLRAWAQGVAHCPSLTLIIQEARSYRHVAASSYFGRRLGSRQCTHRFAIGLELTQSYSHSLQFKTKSPSWIMQPTSRR